MPKIYVVRSGFTFIGDDGAVQTGGARVTLEDDVAAMHLHKLDVPDDESLEAVVVLPLADGDASFEKPAKPGKGA